MDFILISAIICLALMPMIYFWYKYILKLINIRIVIPSGNAWSIIKKMTKKQKETDFTYLDDKYIINLESAVVERNNRLILYYENKNSVPLRLKEAKEVNTKILEKIMKSNVYSRLLGKYKDKFYIMIIGLLIIAYVVTVMYLVYVNSQLNNKVFDLMVNLTRYQTQIPNIVR